MACEEEVFTFTSSRAVYPSRAHALDMEKKIEKLTAAKGSRDTAITDTVEYMRYVIPILNI